jgi:peptide/nickel transport system substrate-binding protein
MRDRSLLRTVAAAVALLTVAGLVACGRADAGEKPSPPKKGGTLRVVLGAMATHLDPQRIKSATEANLSRLTTRTLTTFQSAPGKAASQIVGDLATDTGRPSDNNRTWDFTLKQGLKWEDGSPITCADVKYGTERGFSNLFQVALPYAKQYLVDNDDPYRGPFVGNNNQGKGLESIECVDQKTIRFHLKLGVGDFGYTVALPVFAPVPPAKDTKGDYYKRPYSDGPYKLAQSDGQQLTYVRNNFWDRGTDDVRKAYPDRIIVTADADSATTTNNLIDSSGPWADAIGIEKNVAPQFVQQVINDPVLSKRAVGGSTAGIRYFAINMRSISDVRCRQALEYAFDKRKYRAAAGGSTFGDFATTMISPELAAHRDFDLYGSIGNLEGDPDKAQDLMKQAAADHKPCPTTLKLAFPDQKDIRRQVVTIVESYQLIGVQVQLVGIDPDTYFDVVGNPNNGNDLLYAGWIPDWSNGSAIIPALFDGRLIPTKSNATSNLDFSLLNDPQINGLIDQALAESRLDVQYNLWGQLDEKIQAQAATIPVIFVKALRMAGTNVRGGFIHPQFGQPDLCALGLADPAK